MDELLKEFLTESREHLEGIETDLLSIEETGENIDIELVNKVFRAAHSMKGGAGFFNLSRIQALAHKAENVLDLMRSGKLLPNPEITNILLSAFDALRDMVNDVSQCDSIDISSHMEGLGEIVNGLGVSGNVELVKEVREEQNQKTEGVSDEEFESACRERQYIYRIVYDLIHDLEKKGKSPLEVIKNISSTGYVINAQVNIESVGSLDDPPVKKVPLEIVFRTVLEPDMIDALVDVEKQRVELLFDPNSCGKGDEGKLAETDKTVCVEGSEIEQNKSELSGSTPAAQRSNSKTDVTGDKKASVPITSETLRVSVSVLEMLMNQAGELVLSRNQLIDSMNRNDPQAIKAAAQRIDLVTGELQEVIMQTRLQPVGNLFNKFPRVVRDMSRKMDKEIDFVIEGKGVELDKTLIEGLSDPLTHMIRNAVDHGLESPSRRESAGKSRVGKLVLRASHQAGQVVIEISDDGRGIDAEMIAQKALDKGVVKSEQLNSMSQKDKTALLFMPGLSTAEKVTDISGRGVGMDVVKTNLDRLGGKVEIDSVPGAGTKFLIKLPLTLAIIPSLIISVEGERFAIPQVNVAELLRIRAADVKRRIEVVGDAEVLVLRGKMLPLIRFSEVAGMVPTYIDPKTGRREFDRRKRIADRRSPHHSQNCIEDKNSVHAGNSFAEKRENDDRRFHASGDLNIVVASSGLLQYGILVDALHNSEEIVVKPLGQHLKGLSEYAGATIMGDGRVALILDAAGLAAKANITSVSSTTRAKELQAKEVEEIAQDNISLLLFNNSPTERCAMPLELVRRVERIESKQIETTASRRSMQYRGKTLPLVTLADSAQVQQIAPEGKNLAVIVTSVNNRDVGLLCHMPVEVIETSLSPDRKTIRQKGISGSVIISDTTILMVDIYELVETAWPEWVRESNTKGENKHTILLAEDSEFFRSQICKHLSDAGFTVIEAVDGEDAWEKLLKHKDQIEAVVTDIEMPRMNGFELCTRIRENSSFSSLPLIAVTSLAGDDDKAMGMKVGVTDYQVKLDRDRLISSLEEIVSREKVAG
ncbi:Signal transduction histidine kinase CheA [Chitinispirillum alkaliphilum]|nr:Signal transduction histidine kinase CheA [Chitinispirillum alkaliphilum]